MLENLQLLVLLRFLAEGIRKARARKPALIISPKGIEVFGYEIDLNQVPVATENVFHNYDENIPCYNKL